MNKNELAGDFDINDKDSNNSDKKNYSIIKELQDENKKLIDQQVDAKNLLDILSKSNKQLSPSSSNSSKINKETTKCSTNLSELEECKIEIKRLRESLDKLKSTIGSTSQNSSIISRAILPVQQITISSPVNLTTSPSNSTPTNSIKNTRELDYERPSSNSSVLNSNLSTDQSLKKIRTLEESIRELHKNLNNKKQEESALLTDMEITGQAFEDMQVSVKLFKLRQNLNFELLLKVPNVNRIFF
jgi:myosin heavy subunit